MNTGVLTLEVSVTVFASSLDSTKLQLQSEDGTQQYRLTSSTTTVSSDGTSIVLNIGSIDMNAIKRITSIATLLSTTFLVNDEDLFDYTFKACIAHGSLACQRPPFAALTAPLQVRHSYYEYMLV